MSVEEEFVGPFSSWINIQTVYHAHGDGLSDDTEAIQNGLNDIGHDDTSDVLYFPAGTYRITHPLFLNVKHAVSLVGEHPSTTMLTWDSPSPMSMLGLHDITYSRITRLTFDGRNTAHTGIFSNVGIGNQYIDCLFKDIDYGMHGDFAETSILRCAFHNNHTSGIMVDALNCWIWYCAFVDCTIGVSNHSGSFRIYHSYFTRSTHTDILIRNVENFSLRHNTSLQSNCFLCTERLEDVAHISLQGNIILDTIQDTAISIENYGPVFVIDNIIRSVPQAVHPPFVMTQSSCDVFALGNRGTIHPLFAVNGRCTHLHTHIVTPESLHTVHLPLLPSTPVHHHRTIHDIPVRASTAVIQDILNNASDHDVIHFPKGQWEITSPLVLSRHSALQLVGDGPHSVLHHADGVSPVLLVNGSSKVVVRDMTIDGNHEVTGIQLYDVDQQDSRIYTQSVLLTDSETHIKAENLDKVVIDCRNLQHKNATGTSVHVLGGINTTVGSHLGAHFVIYSGASCHNNISYAVENGATLLLRDMWYEGSCPTWIHLAEKQGTVTIENIHMITPVSSSIPLCDITHFEGEFVCIEHSLFHIRSNGMPYIAIANESTTDVFPHERRLHARHTHSKNQLDDHGTLSGQTLIDTLHLTRSMHAPFIHTLSGATDIRLFHVAVRHATIGLHILGTGTVIETSTPTKHHKAPSSAHHKGGGYGSRGRARSRSQRLSRLRF